MTQLMSPSPRAEFGAVILAAGGSTRMGRPKALLPVATGETLIEAHVRALSPRCHPIVVVAGAVIEPLRAALPPGIILAINPAWATTGSVESLAIGLAALGPARRVVITPVDAPPPAPGELDTLLESDAPAALGWAGRPGHPALLGPVEIRRLLEGPLPARGLRALLTAARVVEGDSADRLLNLNTPTEWAAWRDQGSMVPEMQKS
jgi:CTP:molybdopterin cytidylyltransferase MocA